MSTTSVRLGLPLLAGLALALVGCSDDSGSATPGTSSDLGAVADAGADSGVAVDDDTGAAVDAGGGAADVAVPDTTAADPGGSDPGAPDTASGPVDRCAPLPAPPSDAIKVAPGDSISEAVAAAGPGGTVLLSPGTWDVGAAPIWIHSAGVTIRSVTGNPTSVILDGHYNDNGSGEVFGVDASDVTLAEITITRPRYHAIHVTGGSDGDISGVRLYRVRVIDPGEQAIKINPSGGQTYPDDGEVACVYLELTAAGRAQVESQVSSGSTCYTGGVDAHAGQGWVVRDSEIRGFWCHTDISEHGVHFWRGARDTVVERNLLIDNARAIGFGLTTGGGRTYSDGPCDGIGWADHYGGIIRNNAIVGTDPELFASAPGMDGGVALAHACDATVLHNTVVAAQAPFASIEWRFDITDAVVANNLVTHPMRERNGATAVQEGNLVNQPLDHFEDVDAYDLHLVAGSSAINAAAAGYANLCPDDVDGEARDGSPDVGADERL